MTTAAVLAIAMVLDAIFGEPKWLWVRVTHPAVMLGNLIDWADRRLNAGSRRRVKGGATLIVLILMAVFVGRVLETIPGFGVDVIVVTVLLAQRSLADHVMAVAHALAGSLSEGRRAVAQIVGRDTTGMDQGAIARGAIESAAENLSDGVVAPALFYLLFGLPGILAYKMVNTADSMIGYRSPRHAEFGWASARLDDLLNWIPARLTATMIALLAGLLGQWNDISRDAKLHRSPNAGWPEAAMSRALGVALAGPRSYEGKTRNFPFVNASGLRQIGSGEIRASVRRIWGVWWLLLALTLAIAAFA